ncbi:MAG: hypothetical protein HeimC3_55220 [Candidatus Heimdallarchaeota archaeon LC_3]|nr:MAG: hypothetical protein HeimC3_55220 [Candidatus Heimdallarchaeota archaeon LC_3]
MSIFDFQIEQPYNFFNPETTVIIASMPGQQLLDKLRYFPREGRRINVGCGAYISNFMFECEVNVDLKDRRYWKNFLQANVLDLNNHFSSNDFDFYFSSHLFEHLAIDEIITAIEIAENISKNVIILVPQGEHVLGQVYNDHKTLFLEGGLARNTFGEKSPISTVQ